ncbi:bifunctional phosphoglucose/phosphomannose isomerase [Candidatus Woesearchaeota archaeon]|nr:bifunctional phosphoglucose/phosphomannose isomerase [Candidatus Woesearchaeota archaeon]
MTYDKENMLDKLDKFRNQVEEAFKIAKKAKLPKINKNKISNIVVCGMGGSSAGGLLLQSFTKDIPIFVNRNYNLPRYINKNSLVFCVSYSGNTEETLSAYNEAKKRKATVIAITSGGKLAEKEKNLIQIPEGFQPRIALGYTFIPLLISLSRYRLIANQDQPVRDAIRGLVPKTNSKEGFMLAKKLFNMIPVFYASEDMHGVAYICKTLTNENAKQPAFCHFFPEMNHNEINGFKKNAKKIHVVMIKDKQDIMSIKKRMEITKKIIKESSGGVSELHTKGKSLLARMLHTLHIAMYCSYYLALMNKIDPTPVPVIEDLKAKLKK